MPLNKLLALLTLVFTLIGCASGIRTGYYYDEKNPVESFIGISNPEITDTGLLRFTKVNYKLLNEFNATFSHGNLDSLGSKTGKQKWVRSLNYDRFEIEVRWSENPELNQVISTSTGSFNIEDALNQAKKNSAISIICLNCTKAGMPTIIEGGPASTGNINLETQLVNTDSSLPKKSDRLKFQTVNTQNAKSFKESKTKKI